MAYKNIFKVRTQSKVYDVEAFELSPKMTIPEFLRESGAVRIENLCLVLDNQYGEQYVPFDTVVAFEKSDKTASGYSCWSIGRKNVDLKKADDGTYHSIPKYFFATIVPTKNEDVPLWINSSHLTYLDENTVSIPTENGFTTGRVGVDLLVCRGFVNEHITSFIIAKGSKEYSELTVCDDSGNDIGKLCELHSA